jgi:Fe-S-cluster containining protein
MGTWGELPEEDRHPHQIIMGMADCGLPYTALIPVHVHFKCVRCGNCCIFGFVEEGGKREIPLQPDEFARYRKLYKDWILRHLKLGDPTKDDPHGIRIKSRKGNCAMYRPENKSCMIYAHRPALCRAYPLEPVPTWMEATAMITLGYNRAIYPGIGYTCYGWHVGSPDMEKVKKLINWYIGRLKKEAYFLDRLPEKQRRAFMAKATKWLAEHPDPSLAEVEAEAEEYAKMKTETE